MHALSYPLFPNFRWDLTGEYESYNNIAGDNHSNEFLDFPVPKTYGVLHHQISLGVSVSSERNGIDNNSVVIKKLIHNCNERKRRKRTNSLFSSLRSFPSSAETYIPELKEQVQKLIQKKEEILVRVTGQRERSFKPQPKVVASYVSTVFATGLRDNKVMVQISSSRIHNFLIYNVSGLEEDGFVIVNVSSLSSR